MFKRLDTILFLVSASGICLLEVLQIDGSFFIFGLGQIFLGLLLTATFIYAIIRIIKDKRSISFLNKLLPFFFGLLLTAIIPFVLFLVNTDGGKETVLEAGSSSDLAFVHLNLRNDGTFKLTNSGPFGGQNYRGTYTLHNDTLHLSNGDKNLYPTLAFIIKNDTVRRRKFLDPIQIDTSKDGFYKLYILADKLSDSR